MKLFGFFKSREKELTPMQEDQSVNLESSENVIDQVQQEFINKATFNAERIVRAFNVKYDGAFDYSIRSLNVLDHLIEDFGDFANLSDEEMISDFCAQAGSYILEVARRNFGGAYFWEDNLEQPILKTGLPDFEISLLTFGKVRDRIVHGELDNIPHFFRSYMDKIRTAQKGDSITFG
jgi:hypothetical protein